MIKNVYFRLGLIAAIIVLAILVVLPETNINIDNQLLRLKTTVGGYYVNLFDGKFKLDLRRFKEGLDLKGGVRIVLGAKMDKIESSDRDKALESAKEIISRRIDLLGVAEPNVTTLKGKDDYRIIVEIPGLENVSEAARLIGQTAQITFRVLKPDVMWTPDKFLDYYQDPSVWADTGVTGADLKGADVVFSQQTDLKNQGQPQIQLKFTNDGREKFSNLAKENVSKPIGIFLDQSPYPLSMPVVDPDLAKGLQGDPVISGSFDVQSAKALSIQIRAGALPVPVEVLQQDTIGATLGGSSVQKSFFAGVVGLFFVFLFMVAKYGKLGFIAGFSLLIYTLTVLAVFKMIPVVLTLPGIAGFVLSIGMATDANILIFERLKEEIFWGKPRNLAIKLGFERAWNSIRDSNISSLITAFILFQAGTGPVRGFALTLAIGILVSLFTSIFVVRTLIEAFGGRVRA